MEQTLIKVLPGDQYTVMTLYEKLKARAVLESAAGRDQSSRYSLLLVDEAFRLVQEKDGVFLEKEGRRTRREFRDILDGLEYFSEQHQGLHQDLPFPAGGLGFLSFEFVARCDTVILPERPDPLQIPEAVFLFGHLYLVYDHHTGMIYLIGLNYKESRVDLEALLQKTEEILSRPSAPTPLSDKKWSFRVADQEAGEEEYKKNVDLLRREIIKGNLLQAVPSRRLEITTEMPAREAYRKLRSVNPSPYMFFIDFGSFQLFGASPEVHLKIQEGKALIRPLAGTRRRGKTEAEDKALAEDLLSDPKERAEHLMLIDLARNDLGRCCRPKSVRLSKAFSVERYSHVMHIASQVEGEPAEGFRPADLVRASFPAGTVSGAPKIQAIETLGRLEKHPRGFYAGLVGYWEPGGNLDTCITIRSALKKDDLLILQAGGGIVFDSHAERELEETREKLGAFAAALGLRL